MGQWVDDGTEFNPGLQSTPGLCVSCVNHETQDAKEEVACNLTRADQPGDAVFLCFAYEVISPSIDREATLRELCEQAEFAFLEQADDAQSDSGPIAC